MKQRAYTVSTSLSALELVRPYFDPDFYRDEYPDFVGDRSESLHHYCSIGWREGRNPNAFFDTVTYLIEHSDVAQSGVNPYVHYLVSGRGELRSVSPSITPSVRTHLLFGYAVVSWVTLLHQYVDLVYYARHVTPRDSPVIDLAAHFAYRGWREGFSPSATISVSDLLERYPQSGEFSVNPVIVHIESESGRFRPRRVFRVRNFVPATTPTPPGAAVSPGPKQSGLSETTADDSSVGLLVSRRPDVLANDELTVIRSALSVDFYLSSYPDVAASGVEPAAHYAVTGWRENRNPSSHFDTEYYLSANDDVRRAGINPFWHYLVAGMSEGRLAKRPGGYRRELVENAREPAVRTKGYVLGPEEPIAARKLTSHLRHMLRDSDILVISVSHDCYTRVIGGTQIFISDEQGLFNDNTCSYIHISPFDSHLRLVDNDPRKFVARIVADGTELGTANLETLVRALRAVLPSKLKKRFLTVHSVLGFSVDAIMMIATALNPQRRFFWLHDYTSLCEGYNLLRNDLEFCGAPPVTSMACRVCVYGTSRRRHTEEVARLFENIPFEVVSPSDFTLDLWLGATTLPYKAAYVHPHWRLASDLGRPRHARPVSTRQRPRLAFVGFPVAHKGWPLFLQIVGDPRLSHFDFFQFSAPGSHRAPGITFIGTEVRREDREATIDLLTHHRIDIVAVLSPWPETFSFVAYEAIAAGCAIICLKDSGNVADLAKRGYAAVFEDASSMIEFLGSSDVTSWLRSIRRNLRTTAVRRTGTTATIEGVVQ